MSCPRAGCTITSITYATLGNNGGSCPSFSKGSCAVDFTTNATAACVGKQACVVSSNRGHPTWNPCAGIIATSVTYLSIAATYNFLGDGGPATSAVLRNPYGVSYSKLGDVFIADTYAHLVRKVSADSGLMSTIVGIANVPGAPVNELNIAGTTTNLNYPYDVAADRSGNCYIADRNNHRIRKWTASTGMVASFAGYGVAGSNGDNIAATSAKLFSPSGVALDSGGNVYISDTSNNAIRRVDKMTNIITTIVGNSKMASFGGDKNNAFNAYINAPRGIFFDSSNNLYIADTNNNRVRKVTKFCVGCTNIINTIAGNGVVGSAGDGSYATKASLNNPTSIVVNAAGGMYIADSGNQLLRVVIGGSISTAAGTGIAGYDGDGYKSSLASKFNALQGMTIDLLGNIFIADSGNGVIRYLTNLVNPIFGASDPTSQPSGLPSKQPLSDPSALPSSQPSRIPTLQPTIRPSSVPSSGPSSEPSEQPSTHPSEQPTRRPSAPPSRQPSAQPSRQPFSRPSSQPSRQPSAQPSRQPTIRPTSQPSRQPSVQPSRQPSVQPSSQPSHHPTNQPSTHPSEQPTRRPSAPPSRQPSAQPSRNPSSQPSRQPSMIPSFQPSSQPSSLPSSQPSVQPSSQPSTQPTTRPSTIPTQQPSSKPSMQPSSRPSSQPSVQPSSQPSRQPSVQPSSQPSTQPTARPSRQPTQQPTQQPTRQPTRQPTSQPTRQVRRCVYSHIPLFLLTNMLLVYSNLFMYYFFLSVLAYPSTNLPTYTTAHTRTHIHSYGSTELRTIPTALISAQ